MKRVLSLKFKIVFTCFYILLSQSAVAQWQVGPTGYSLGDWKEIGYYDNIFPLGIFRDMEIDPNNEIYVLHTANDGTQTIAHSSIKKSTWTKINTAFNGKIWDILIDNSGNLYAAGEFTNQDGNYYVAKYENNTWQELGGTNNSPTTDFSAIIHKLHADYLNNIYPIGLSKDGNGYLAKYDGSNWSEVGQGMPANNGLNDINTDLSGGIAVSGYFTNGTTIAYLKNNQWHSLNAPVGTYSPTSFAHNGLGNFYGISRSNYIKENFLTKWYILKYDWGIDSFEQIFIDSISNPIDVITFNRNDNKIYCAVDRRQIIAINSSDNFTYLNPSPPLRNGDIGCVNFDSEGNIYIAGDFYNDYTKGTGTVTTLRNFVAVLSNHQMNGIQSPGESISVYPNPANRYLTITLPVSQFGDQYKIINSHGKLVLEGVVLNRTNTLNVQDLPNGLYYLLIGRGTMLNSTFVVSH